MCGRYSVYVDDDPEIREIIEQVQRLHPEVETGEIFPTDFAPVLISGNNGGHLDTAMPWGFPAWKGTSRLFGGLTAFPCADNWSGNRSRPHIVQNRTG